MSVQDPLLRCCSCVTASAMPFVVCCHRRIEERMIAAAAGYAGIHACILSITTAEQQFEGVQGESLVTIWPSAILDDCACMGIRSLQSKLYNV